MSEPSFSQWGGRWARLSVVAATLAATGVGLVVARWVLRPARKRRVLPVRLSPFASLRFALLNKSKKQIARALGPPPTATAPPDASGKQTIWSAATWYYPFDYREQAAIAIQFERDRAKRVEYITHASPP